GIFAGIFMQNFSTIATSAAMMPPPPPSQQPIRMERMPLARRTAVIATFEQVQTLSQPRPEMFDQLLCDIGDDLFPFSAEQMNSQRIRGVITKSGQYPAAGATPGNDYFVLTTGRIELADDHALFSPTSGEATSRVYRDRSSTTQKSDPAG